VLLRWRLKRSRMGGAMRRELINKAASVTMASFWALRQEYGMGPEESAAAVLRAHAGILRALGELPGADPKIYEALAQRLEGTGVAADPPKI